ncbi:S8 family peptidase [Devosia neptuniae]|jgi:subtilase-type serine protease|uniref:S8 family peptidase n=1 Tax=Devosia TaxID=46913 RepID=UPI0022B05DAB|nr:S8 family peptidase [Devosia neptuniae]MCZ4344729.1 S8 family serine peptidase [Devosia neptuniae]|tara:strand:+ start:41622 stop:44030 length:2409 start_codon:yes stop_codon:yes gene_type:complete
MSTSSQQASPYEAQRARITIAKSLLSTALMATVLSACGGGGGGGSSGGAPSSTPSATSGWATRSVTFNPAVAASILLSAEFRNVDANCTFVGCAAAGTPAVGQSQAFELHNLHTALSSGVTGAGKLVAVVDDGFRLTHREFSGKTLSQTGALPLADHGTHVASLIAGVKDGVGMHGVAPGANLHLTSFDPAGGGTLDIDNVIAGTLNAASLGAVAQNNSWGYNVDARTLQNHLTANPGHSTAQALNAVVAGFGAAKWQSYLDALNTFENGGVVVWALSNDNAMTSGDVMATLPYFDTRLQGAWIAAANGYFEVNGAGDISKAIRLSAACGLAARFCIAGDGTTTAANGASDSGYSAGTGTSYVAPQISGAVALLAQAFPDMTPEEWAKRLMASADNSWFSTLGVPVAGSVDFGNGVSHAYSTEWGHGVLDIGAALAPIGSVAVLSGATVTSSARVGLAESVLLAPAAFGDGLTTALEGTDVAVFDALNRGFAVEGSALVSRPAPTMLPDLLGAVETPHWGALPSYQQLLRQAPNLAEDGASVAMLSSAAGVFEQPGSIALAERSSVFGMVQDAVAVIATQNAGPLDITAIGFAGRGVNGQTAGIGGTGVNLSWSAGGSRASVGVSFMNEQGGLLGMPENAAFGWGTGSAAGTAHIGLDQQIATDLALFGRLEYGVARQSGATSGLVASMSDLQFSGFEVGARMNSVLFASDRLSFSLAQPLRIESGTMGLSLPVSRNADGAIEHRQQDADLTPGGREFNLSLAYSQPMGSGQWQIGLQHRLDAGHIQGASSSGLALGVGQSF